MTTNPASAASERSFAAAAALPIAVAIGLALGLAGLMLVTRTAGDAQVNFVSQEITLGAPGGRLIYYPGRSEAVLKVWSLPNLPPGQAYQVWGMDEIAGPRLLGEANSSNIQKIDLFLHTDLIRVKEVVVTAPVPPGDPGPRGPTVTTLAR